MSDLSIETRQNQLLGYVRPNVYRINAYRVTGLPFQATTDQVVAAVRAPVASANAPLAPGPALTPSDREAAASRHLDGPTLLLDEFFWLWPQSTLDGRDRALEALARGAWLDAAELWRVQCQRRTHDGIALHNMAVLFHVMALDLESLGEVSGRQAQERDVWWREAFRAWQSLHEHDAFWKLCAERLGGRLTAESRLEYVESLRSNLLAAIVAINGELAAQRCSIVEAWDRQITLIGATGFTAEDTFPARNVAVDPHRQALRAAISEAVERTEVDARQGLVEAGRLIDHGRGWLPFFTKASLSAELRELSDEVASAAMGCLDARGRAAGGWVDLLAAAEAVLSMAQSTDTRARLSKQLLIFRTNYSTQVHAQREEQLGALRIRCSAILSSDAPGKERLGQLIKCARGDLRELIAAGGGDEELDAEATSTVARALRDLALVLEDDGASQGEPLLITMDALAAAGSISQDTYFRAQLANERDRLERLLLSLQSEEFSESEGEYPLLTEYATPELYGRNAFRLTGASARASERELSRHVQKIEMAARLGAGATGVVGPLGIAPADAEATKAAVQRIHDVEHRLLDEFFWLWPLPEYATEHPVANTPMPSNEEQLAAAIEAWTTAANEPEGLDHGISAHNLAVVRHLQALDFELRQRTTALSADECATRDTAWSEALRHWEDVLSTPTFWEEVAQRIVDLGDPRLDRRTMVRLRSGLATAVLSTAVRLAVRAHDREPGELTRLAELVTSSGFDPDAVVGAAAPLVDRIREMLSRQALDASEQAEKAPMEAHVLSQQLMAKAWPSLELLTQLLDQEDPVVIHSHDEVAIAAADCLFRFARETKDWPAVLKTLRQIERLARGPSAKETIRGYLETVKRNALFERATADLDALAAELRSIVSASIPATERFAQVRALIDGRRPLADDPEYLAARGDLFAHWLQQLALRVNNEDEKYALAVDIIRVALTLCEDTDLRQKLTDAQETISRNADGAAVTGRCNEIINGATSNPDKLRELGSFGQNELKALKAKHGGDREFTEIVSDTVARAIRSVCIDLSNNDLKFATALEWLRYAASVAQGAELKQRLAQDIATCQGLVQSAARPLPPAEGQRRVFTSCANCNSGIVLLSHRDSQGRVFCSEVCATWFNGPRTFCGRCLGETTDESVGGLRQINGVGDTFIGTSDKCPTCGSVVRRKVVTAVWLPVFPQSRYRVLYTSPSTFYSRKMK